MTDETPADMTERVAVSAYAIACPRCRSAAGDPCRERYCRNGRRDCDYAICSRIRDLPEPHVARVARAAAQGGGSRG